MLDSEAIRGFAGKKMESDWSSVAVAATNLVRIDHAKALQPSAFASTVDGWQLHEPAIQVQAEEWARTIYKTLAEHYIESFSCPNGTARQRAGLRHEGDEKPERTSDARGAWWKDKFQAPSGRCWADLQKQGREGATCPCSDHYVSARGHYYMPNGPLGVATDRHHEANARHGD